MWRGILNREGQAGRHLIGFILRACRTLAACETRTELFRNNTFG